MGMKRTSESRQQAVRGATDKAAGAEPVNIEVLKECGGRLDEAPPEYYRIGRYRNSPRARTWREYLMWTMLNIRDKHGHLRHLALNRAQQDLEASSSKRNIVLKARQLGITTYVAARFFINCVCREGTLSVQVAHDQRSAEEIFRIVHRLLENLPEPLRKGALETSRANVRQIVFPKLDSEYRVETAADPNAGRGLTIHNLHCSEVARWPRDVAETLASLRAAVPPEGEIFLESTPNGAGGTFYDEWQRAAQTGYTRHFYPWWWDPSYRRPVKVTDFTERGTGVDAAARAGCGSDCVSPRNTGELSQSRAARSTPRMRRAASWRRASACLTRNCRAALAAGGCRWWRTNDHGKMLMFLPPVPVGERDAEAVHHRGGSGGRRHGGRLFLRAGDRSVRAGCSARSCMDTFRRRNWRRGWRCWRTSTTRRWWRWSATITGTRCWRT